MQAIAERGVVTSFAFVVSARLGAGGGGKDHHMANDLTKGIGH